MSHEFDPVDDALKSLQAEARSGIAPNREIEERLMMEFRRQQTSGGIRRHRSLVIALAFLLVGGVGFAATGGPEFVKKYVFVRMIKITGHEEGEVAVNLVLEPAENGDGTAVATLGSVDGDKTTITLAQVPPELTDDGQQKTQITVGMERRQGDEDDTDPTMSATVNVVQLSPQDPSADDATTTFIIRHQNDGTETVTLESLDENAMIWDWVDDYGLDRELRLIPDDPDAGAPTYTVLTALETDNNMKIYRTVGSFEYESGVADVLDVFEDENGALVLELVGEDGHRQIIELPTMTTDESRGDKRHSFRLQRSHDTPE